MYMIILLKKEMKDECNRICAGGFPQASNSQLQIA